MDCSSPSLDSYSFSLHVGAIFIILAMSLLGTLVPLCGKYIPRLAPPPFTIILGKCAGTGIVLACALVHMLEPGTESLQSPCLPPAFQAYSALSFFFAMIATLAMQALEMAIASAVSAYLPGHGAHGHSHGGHGHSHGHDHGHDHGHAHVAMTGDAGSISGTSSLSSPRIGDATAATVALAAAVGVPEVVSAESSLANGGNEGVCADAACEELANNASAGVLLGSACGECEETAAAAAADCKTCNDGADAFVDIVPQLAPPPGLLPVGRDAAVPIDPTARSAAGGKAPAAAMAGGLPVAVKLAPAALAPTPLTPTSPQPPAADEQPLIVGHSHGAPGEGMTAVSSNAAAALTSAVMLEFGLAVHSIFIGLAVGVTDDASLLALLIALSFHQFFEGLSLGSRLVDTQFILSTDLIMAAVFALSAPLGMAVGVAVIGGSGIDTNGSTFLIVQGSMDSFCAGILLYIGFTLLLADFPTDVRRFGLGPRAALKRAAMFAALWIGGGLMAFIGLYL